MAVTHVAHDCQVGDHVVLANLSGLGGHVVVEDRAVLGGMAAIHQFVRVGKMALVAGLAKVVKDVMPFMIVDGNPARCRGLNVVALQRNGVRESAKRRLKKAYRTLCRTSLNTSQALAEIEQEVDDCPEIAHLIDFVQNSRRGMTK
jgi:UDP-N-acetylglucosamine acyltransferase